MPKKVIYIIQSLGIGGAEVALLSAIPALNATFDFKLICLKKIDPRISLNLTKLERNNIITFDGLPFNYFSALRFILKFNPDIVISSLWKAAVLGIITKLVRPQIKYVEFIHSTTFFHLSDKFLTMLALKKSDIIFCDSTSSQIFIKEYAKSKQIEIISFLRFTSPKTFKPKIKIRLKGLYIGRFHELKRVDRLVLLAKKMVEAGLYFEVDLYGRDDGALNSVKQLIKEYKLEENVILKGEIESYKIKEVLNHYDYYLQTSAVEGMAMSVVEAMQHGLVSVVTNVGEIKNYARNAENAIVISEPFEDHIEDAIQLIKKSAIDIEFYNKLSQNAYLEFANKMQFCDSIVKKLSEI